MKELFLRSQEKLEQWSSLILRRQSFPYQQSQQTFECLPSRLGADDKKDKNLHLADGHLAGKCRGSPWLQNVVRNSFSAAGPRHGGQWLPGGCQGSSSEGWQPGPSC